MQTILVISRRSAGNEDLRAFVSEWGGIWDGDATLNHGVIQRGPATIFCNRATSMSVNYSDEDCVEIAGLIGTYPQISVAIDISRGAGSQELALQFANGLVQRWGGLVDGNRVVQIENGWQG